MYLLENWVWLSTHLTYRDAKVVMLIANSIPVLFFFLRIGDLVLVLTY